MCNYYVRKYCIIIWEVSVIFFYLLSQSVINWTFILHLFFCVTLTLQYVFKAFESRSMSLAHDLSECHLFLLYEKSEKEPGSIQRKKMYLPYL